jgi:hypothetical protein
LFAGRYQILATLGSGGMGMVYKAHDRSLDENVALKVIRPDLARQAHLHDRFRSEIKLARRIRHKNVCSVYGDGDENGVLWVCMELVDGVDLRELVRTQGLPAPDAFDVAIQIAEGLQAIHDVGIIHRDLKSANVMRDNKGVVRLMDFGLAKQWLAEGVTGATASGHVVGTPDYMSPEQARGEKLTFASDVYALGVLTFELFTGEPPFRGDTPLSTLLMHLNAPPPLEAGAGMRLPSAVVPALRRALAKRPADRFDSAAAMADALRRARDLSQANGDSATPTQLRAQSSATTDVPAPTEAMPARAPRALSQSHSWTRPFRIEAGARTWALGPIAGVVAVAVASVVFLRREAPAPLPASETFAVPPRPLATARIAPPAYLALPQVPETKKAFSGLNAPVDDRDDFIHHEPVGCMVASQFSLLEAKAPDADARVYFRSSLGSGYYFVEMTREGGRYVGKLPKPKMEASPITYFVEAALADGRAFRTPEVAVVVVPSAGACPAGKRVATIGPPGAVTVFDVKLPFLQLRDALSLEALVSQLKDPDAGVRQVAAEALRNVIPAVRTVVDEALVNLKHRDPDVREHAANKLQDVSELVVKEAVIPLVAALKDKNPDVQIGAARSLGAITPPVAAAARALRGALRDPEPGVRKKAIEALAAIGSVAGTTLTALEDASAAREGDAARVRRAATAAHHIIEEAGR